MKTPTKTVKAAIWGFAVFAAILMASAAFVPTVQAQATGQIDAVIAREKLEMLAQSIESGAEYDFGNYTQPEIKSIDNESITMIYNMVNVVTSLNPRITVLSSTEKKYSNSELGAVELSKDANLALENNAREFNIALLKAMDLKASMLPTVLGPLTDLCMQMAEESEAQAQRYQNDLWYNLGAAPNEYLTAAGFVLNGGLHIGRGAMDAATSTLRAASHIENAALFLVQVVRALLNGPDWENATNNANAAVDECANSGDDIRAGEQALVAQAGLAIIDIRSSVNPALQGATLTEYLVIDVALFPTFTALFLTFIVAAMVCAIIEGNDLIPAITETFLNEETIEEYDLTPAITENNLSNEIIEGNDLISAITETMLGKLLVGRATN